LVLSVLDAVENIEEMDQLIFHLHALKAHPRELASRVFKELGLSVAEAAKAIGMIKSRSSERPEMAARFDRAFGGGAE
jgi:hypothetical protein